MSGFSAYFGANVVPPVVIESFPTNVGSELSTPVAEGSPLTEELTPGVLTHDEATLETALAVDEAVSDGDAVENEQKHPGWFRRNRFKVVMGAAVLSTAVTLVADPIEKEIKPVAAAAASMAASDAVWAVSAAAMYRSAFGEWKNPLKISKEELGDAATRAYNSRAFKAAYAVNTLAATAFFAIPTAIVTTNMPVESWGVLAPSAAEFSTTVAARLAINAKLKEHGQK